MFRASQFLRSSNAPKTISSFAESTANMTLGKKLYFMAILTGTSVGAVSGLYVGINTTLKEAKTNNNRWVKIKKDRTLSEQIVDFGIHPVFGGLLGTVFGGIGGAFTVTFSPIIIPLACYGIYYENMKKEKLLKATNATITVIEARILKLKEANVEVEVEVTATEEEPDQGCPMMTSFLANRDNPDDDCTTHQTFRRINDQTDE